MLESSFKFIDKKLDKKKANEEIEQKNEKVKKHQEIGRNLTKCFCKIGITMCFYHCLL